MRYVSHGGHVSLRLVAGAMPNYNFTVDSLLESAGRSRSRVTECDDDDDVDHIVELQLVVAAVNTLSEDSFWRSDWTTLLVDFFNDERNLQRLERSLHQKKHVAVSKLIDGERLTMEEKDWIEEIKDHWKIMKRELRRFYRFKKALDRTVHNVRFQ